MNQKLSDSYRIKKSAASKIGIPRRVCNASKFLSPLIMQDAFAETANSRNLSTLGSRQTVTIYDISMKITCSSNCFKANNFSTQEMYLSNFERNKTSLNSLYVLKFEQTFLSLTTFSKAFPGMEDLNKKALSNVLVSTTNRSFFIQQFLKNFFCKAILHCLITDFVKQGKEFTLFQATGKNYHLYLDVFFKLFFDFRRDILPDFSSGFIHFQYNSFHNDQFYCFLNLQKIRI